MTWAPSEVQKVLFTILTTDAALCTLLGTTPLPGGTQKVFDFTPDNTPYPYISFHPMPYTNRDNHTWDGMEVEFQLDVWYRELGRGTKDVQAIQFRIDQLLNNASPCVEGWNIVSLKRSFVDIQTDLSDGVTKQGIQRFKLLLGEA